MIKHWQKALHEFWDVEAQLSQLDGEYDLNFLATGDQDYVLKVMRAGCDSGFIDLQCRAFDHIQANTPDVPMPAIIKTVSGERYISAPDEAGAMRILWLMQKIEGKTYAKWCPHSADLLHDVGINVGAMDRALADFDHPSLQRSFKWNMMESIWISQETSSTGDLERRALIEEVIHEFQAIKPMLDTLPFVAIRCHP